MNIAHYGERIARLFMSRDKRYFVRKVRIYRGWRRALAIWGMLALVIVPFMIYYIIAVSDLAMRVFYDAGNALLIAKLK